ncbi:MAG: hypothetical protein IT293_13860, partial [Deltaproteobacteria bacterium]|nr:hypothetical protein [Deltaproteobacteria bacterium]
MKLILKSGLLAAMMLALVGSSPAHAIFGQVGTASGCKAGKAKCVTKMKSCLLGCYGKAFGKGTPVDVACVDKCRTGFLADPATGKGCMEKLDTKNDNCGATIGDAAVVRSKVEAHVAELAATLNPAGGNPLNKCLSGKTKCVSKYNACVLGIVGKAFKAGSTVGDLSKCNAILSNAGGKASCVQKLEDKNPPASATACVTFEDQGSLKAADDAFVNDIIYGMVGSGNLAAHRCVSETWKQCTSDGDCTGGAGDCQRFFGSPLPLVAGGVNTCVTSQWNGTMSGTFNQASGASGGTASVLSRVYTTGTINNPCPVCNGADIPNDGLQNGTCTGGARNGQACDRNGESPVPSFGYTSLDCPPSGAPVATLPVDLSNTNNGTVTKTLSAGSPNCNGAPGKKCMCASCSEDSQKPCASDADCTGTCSNAAGTPRQPHACLDDTNTGPVEGCAALAGGEGQCDVGPVDQQCKIENFRGCLTDGDCPATGDSCGVHQRECFAGYNGTVGETITAVGSHSAPHNHTGTSTFATIFCVAPTGASAVNNAAGLPGPG